MHNVEIWSNILLKFCGVMFDDFSTLCMKGSSGALKSFYTRKTESKARAPHLKLHKKRH